MMSYLLINIIPNRCLTLNFSLAKLCLVLLLTISLDSKCWLSASPSPSHDVSVIFSDLLDILPISQMLMLLDADDIHLHIRKHNITLKEYNANHITTARPGKGQPALKKKKYDLSLPDDLFESL